MFNILIPGQGLISGGLIGSGFAVFNAEDAAVVSVPISGKEPTFYGSIGKITRKIPEEERLLYVVHKRKLELFFTAKSKISFRLAKVEDNRLQKTGQVVTTELVDKIELGKKLEYNGKDFLLLIDEDLWLSEELM